MIFINSKIEKTLKRISEIDIEISNYENNPLSKNPILPDLYRQNLEDKRILLNQKLETLKNRRDHGTWNKVVWRILAGIFVGVIIYLITSYII